jgi:hypothetical protein
MMIPCKVQDAAGPSSLRSAEAASNGRKNPPRARDTQQRIPLLPKETATLPLDTAPVPPLYGTLTETLFRHAPYPLHNPLAPPPPPDFPTIGKKFSNHWKTPENFFQSLENFSGNKNNKTRNKISEQKLSSSKFVSPFVPFVSHKKMSRVVFQVV